MDWEKSRICRSTGRNTRSALYNKWRDYLGMGPGEEALAIIKRRRSPDEYEKQRNRKNFEAAELYRRKKWPGPSSRKTRFSTRGMSFLRKKHKAKTFYKALLTKYNSVLRRDAMERLYCIRLLGKMRRG